MTLPRIGHYHKERDYGIGWKKENGTFVTIIYGFLSQNIVDSKILRPDPKGIFYIYEKLVDLYWDNSSSKR